MDVVRDVWCVVCSKWCMWCRPYLGCLDVSLVFGNSSTMTSDHVCSAVSRDEQDDGAVEVDSFADLVVVVLTG